MLVELQVSWGFGAPRVLSSAGRWVVQIHPSCSRDQLWQALSPTGHPDLVEQALCLWSDSATNRHFVVSDTTLSIVAVGDDLLDHSEASEQLLGRDA
jgi:hypothetical protein